MDERVVRLSELVRAHKFVPNKLRTNISRDLVWHGARPRPFLRKAVLSNTLRSGPIVDLCREMLGDFVNSVTLNHNVTCAPHRDGRNLGESAILFFGDCTDGELCIEDGRDLSERNVSHFSMAAPSCIGTCLMKLENGRSSLGAAKETE